MFLPPKATRCTNEGEIWHGGSDQRLPYQIAPLDARVGNSGCGSRRNGLYVPYRVYSSRDPYEICEFSKQFHGHPLSNSVGEICSRGSKLCRFNLGGAFSPHF